MCVVLPTEVQSTAILGLLSSTTKWGLLQAGQCFNFLAHNMAQYRDPNNPTFTSKLRRFVSIFLKSVGETKYAQ